MINLVNENVISDIRKIGLNVSRDIIDKINETINLQDSELHKVDTFNSRTARDSSFLVADGSDVIVYYTRGKFEYNPKKLKLKDFEMYDVYEIESGGVSVTSRRRQRMDDLTGMISTKDKENLPASTNYVYSKNYDPQVNRDYYVKVLQQNKLPEYIKDVQGGYDTIKTLIDEMRDWATNPGKKDQYNKHITALLNKLRSLEQTMVQVRNNYMYTVDVADELVKRVNAVKRVTSDANKFLAQERKERSYKGKPRKWLEPVKIEK